jgi:hypothetical protein
MFKEFSISLYLFPEGNGFTDMIDEIMKINHMFIGEYDLY